jgi:HEAT repeat protein
MGLFDLFSRKKGQDAPRSKSQRELARLGRLVGNKLAQNYDRQEAIEALSKMGTAESASLLLKRFDWNMDPSITDQEEKQAAVSGIVVAGDAALSPLRDYCKKAPSLTWPLKVLKEIVPQERMVDELLGILDMFDTEYARNVEPKVQLLQYLEDFACEDVRVAVEPFLGDTSEPVRFTAVRTVFAVADPASAPALVAALEEEESLRVKNAIAQGMSSRRWSVPEELRETCAASLPDGFTLSKDGTLQGSV